MAEFRLTKNSTSGPDHVLKVTAKGMRCEGAYLVFTDVTSAQFNEEPAILDKLSESWISSSFVTTIEVTGVNNKKSTSKKSK
jgi:hypothetical protein